MKRAGEDVGERLKPAFLRAASVVAVEARGIVPARTGALRDTIGPGATKRGALVRAGFARVPYAGPINYGTPKSRTIAPMNLDAVWFINEAATSTEGTWVPIVTDAVNEVLEDIVVRTNR